MPSTPPPPPPKLPHTQEDLPFFPPHILIASFLLTLLCNYLSHLYMTYRHPHIYTHLRHVHKHHEWNTRLISTIHAVLVGVLSVYVMLTEGHSLYTDTTHTSIIAPLTITITTGYLLGDASLVLFSLLPPSLQHSIFSPFSFSFKGKEDKKKKDATPTDTSASSSPLYGPISAPYSTLAHHLVGALSFYLSVHFRAAYVLSIMFISTELSTPFINNRWCMHEAVTYTHTDTDTHTNGERKGKGKTKERGTENGKIDNDTHTHTQIYADLHPTLYLINGCLMVGVFGCVRVCMLPFQASMVWRHVSVLVRVSNVWVGVQCVCSFVMIAVLNCYWFWMMVKGLKKLIHAQTHTQTQTQKEKGNGKGD
jgi:hypothetical protein